MSEAATTVPVTDLSSKDGCDKLTLCSSDGHWFVLDEAAAKRSMTVRNILEDLGGSTVPLPNVNGAVLAKVAEHMMRCHANEVNEAAVKAAQEPGSEARAAGAEAEARAAGAEAEARAAGAEAEARAAAMKAAKAVFDEYVSEMKRDLAEKQNRPMLFDLILAANYLNLADLLDMTCELVASLMRGRTAEEIRLAFDIKNDFTPEEEEEIRRENMWAFD